MKCIKLAAVFAIAAPLCVAAAQARETRIAVSDFDKIELAGSDSIVVVPGATTSVMASGDARAIAALKIDVRGGTLRVGRRPGTSRDGDALVTVTAPSLRSALISGSGDISIGTLSSRRFAGRISGSGSLVLADLRTETAELDLSGSGSIIAHGRANAVRIGLGGSGRIDTRKLSTPTLTVDLNGIGTVDASASRTATVGADGSGDVQITGGARCDVRRSGVATVRCG